MLEWCTQNATSAANLAYSAAMILFAVAYAVRDILWLRVLTVVAASLTLPFFLTCSSNPQYVPLAWQSFFVAINAFHIGLLLYERRPVTLSDDEQRLHMLAFRELSPRELLKLLSVAEWREAEPGEFVLHSGETADGLMLVFSGIVDVLSGSRVYAQCRDGQCLAEMSYVTGQPTSTDVVAATHVRYVYWPREKLEELFEREPKLRDVVTSYLGFDMAEKLAARSDMDVTALRGG